MKKMMRFVKGKRKEGSRDGDQRSETSLGSRSSLAMPMSASTSALNIQGNLRFPRDAFYVFAIRLPVALNIPVQSAHETVTIILESKSRGRKHY